MNYQKQIEDAFSQKKFVLTETQVNQFNKYLTFLLQWNEKINLTAIRTPEGMIEKHFLDSAMLSRCGLIMESKNLLDVGSGAGFPAAPIKILYPNILVTAIESIGKKAKFIKELCEHLSLSIDVLQDRAETLSHMPDYREKFDLVSARAVAPLQALAEYCLPFVRIGGSLIAMKGPAYETEQSDAQHIISKLGGNVERIESYALNSGERRTLLIINKIASTPIEYPRSAQAIKRDMRMEKKN